jgi:hypothetical protein
MKLDRGSSGHQGPPGMEGLRGIAGTGNADFANVFTTSVGTSVSNYYNAATVTPGSQ